MNDADVRQEVLALQSELEMEPLHVDHVTRLALSLFDSLAGLHRLNGRHRLLLEAASALHDIGHHNEHLDDMGHHKRSARLIRAHPWKSLSPPEVDLMAQVARYHVGAMPKLKHEPFAALTENGRAVVRRLAAILRLADALDCLHERRVEAVSCEIRPNDLVFRLTTNGPVGAEVITAHRKGNLATEVFRRRLVFMVGKTLIQPGMPLSETAATSRQPDGN